MVMVRVTAGIVVRIEARVERGIKVKFVVLHLFVVICGFLVSVQEKNSRKGNNKSRS